MSWLSKKLKKVTVSKAVAKLKPSKAVIAATAFIPVIGAPTAGALAGARAGAEMYQSAQSTVSKVVTAVKPIQRAVISSGGKSDGGRKSINSGGAGGFVGGRSGFGFESREQAFEPEYLQNAFDWFSW